MKAEMWKSSMAKFRSTKWLTLMAIFLALRVVVSRFSIPVAESLNIGLSFILVAFAGMLFGPAAGMIFGAVEDLVEFIVFPSGYGFFAGYTLSAALGILCYALFLYDQKISIVKIIAAKALATYPVSVLLGSYWRWLLLGKSKAFMVYMVQSLIKNSILFPLQVVILVILFNLLIPYLSRHGFMKAQKKPLPWI
jgi:ECF transporter S component (folate family)